MPETCSRTFPSIGLDDVKSNVLNDISIDEYHNVVTSAIEMDKAITYSAGWPEYSDYLLAKKPYKVYRCTGAPIYWRDNLHPMQLRYIELFGDE